MIVTISREFGAGAVGIAKLVAERCGLRLIVDDLPQALSDRLGLTHDTSLHDEDSAPTLLQRLITQLPGAAFDIAATPGIYDVNAYDERHRRIEQSLKELAEGIEAVIVGRAASQVLGQRWNVVRVFLHAPRSWRIERVVAEFGYTPGQAAAAADRIDAVRERYLLEYYGGRLCDARGYDLSIDTSRLSEEEAAELIVSTVATRYNAQ